MFVAKSDAPTIGQASRRPARKKALESADERIRAEKGAQAVDFRLETRDGKGASHLWVAPLDRRTPPRDVLSGGEVAETDQPLEDLRVFKDLQGFGIHCVGNYKPDKLMIDDLGYNSPRWSSSPERSS